MVEAVVVVAVVVVEKEGSHLNSTSQLPPSFFSLSLSFSLAAFPY